MNDIKLFSLIFVLASMHHTTKADRQAQVLLALRLSLNASKNQLLNWIQQDIETCSWEAIHCDNYSNIVQVELNSMGFTGQLSPGIGELKHLEVLLLGDNSITGGIPEELGSLTSLKTLNLENNRLTGKIPSSLSKLKNLQELYLNQNNFDGSIPDSFTNITSLSDIRLAYNNLTGKIPEKLFKISHYDFSGNKLNCGQGYQYSCVSALLSQGVSDSFKTKFRQGSIGAAVSLLLIAVAFLLCIAIRKFHKREVFVDVPGEDTRFIPLGKLKRFTWQELKLATENFSENNVVGQGAYGEVYKGVLQDNSNIAVKRLKDGLSPFGESFFLREIEIISRAVHQNVLKLIGFCTTPSERLLVYPFMPNLSVAHNLRELKPEDPVLDWSTRKKVAIGTARALSYLHECCNPKIIHRDIKAANVLLDENFEAVVGDFGLAKLVDVKKTSVTTVLRGTMSHLAPEYISTDQPAKHMNVSHYIGSNVPILKEFCKPSTKFHQGTSTLQTLSTIMLSLQKYEFKTNHEEWINTVKPRLGLEISGRVRDAVNSTYDNIKYLYKARAELRAALRSLLKDDGVLVIPTIPDFLSKYSSKRKMPPEFEDRLFMLLSLAGLSGCCQVSIPLGKHESYPISLSIVAAHGADKFLLDTVLDMHSSLQEQISIASNSAPLPDFNGDMDASELLKEKGNAAFKGKQWNKAVNLYTEAINLNDSNATYYCNRAAAYLELGCYQQAEADCNQAILLDKKNVKAYLRRGTAREMLVSYKEAAQGPKKHHIRMI